MVLPPPQREYDENMEAGPSAAIYAQQENVNDDDPFGLVAAERKVKALRERRAGVQPSRSRAPAGARAPLGTIAVDDAPSSDVRIPEHLPTPLPSDDDHNIDDLYLDIDPVRPGHSRHSEELEYVEDELLEGDDEDGDGDKEVY